MNKQRLIWVDLEMTGLDCQQDMILEIACIITESNLQIVAEGPVLAIHQPAERLQQMDDWNSQHHQQSGLLDRVRQSKLSTAEAEQLSLAFIRQHVPAGCSPICGNSVCQDRRFLARLMPQLEAHFHYRLIDVSTIKELVSRWKPELPHFHKHNRHRALDDIRESIEELRHYRHHLFSL